ncbi:MAG: tripartite tricarboxylate transporter substrate-binding protein, partial [Verrucomicrobiota bacterium]
RARKIGQDLQAVLGQNILVENKPGAGGVLGTDLLAKAPADGYTIGMGNLAALSVNVSLMKKIPYDPVKDVAPVILIEKSPLILTAGPGLKATFLTDRAKVLDYFTIRKQP